MELTQNGFSPRQFAKRNGIGVTKTYEEINTGRLVAHKCGTRTIITIEEERAWLERLPKLPARSCLTSKVDPVAYRSFSEADFMAAEQKGRHGLANQLRAKLKRAGQRGSR